MEYFQISYSLSVLSILLKKEQIVTPAKYGTTLKYFQCLIYFSEQQQPHFDGK